jgi:cyclophilin family peptidyl-prolyl cis-trans isomerase
MSKRTAAARRRMSDAIERLERRTMMAATAVGSVGSQSLTVGTTPAAVSVASNFDDSAVPAGDTVVVITTDLPAPNNSFPIYLTNTATPNTVANFLKYITSSEYANTIIHRSIPGFIVQGGGFYSNGSSPTSFGTIDGESSTATLKNATIGTIAMALPSGPDSANGGSDNWFFNLADNSGLDSASNPTNSSSENPNQGPFTAFGETIYNGLTAINAIAAVTVYNASSLNSAWSNLPLQNYDNAAIVPSNYITTNFTIESNPLTFTVSSSVPGDVTASISATGSLQLTPLAAGSATITVTATDLGGGTATQSIPVTVAAQPAVPVVSIGSVSGQIGVSNQVSFPITVTNPTDAAITLDYTTVAGTAPAGDFHSSTGTLTIPAEADASAVAVLIEADSTGADETFSLQLSGLSSNAEFAGGAGTISGTATIEPAAVTTPVLTLGSATGTAGAGKQLAFPVTLSKAATGAVTVAYTTQAGTAVTGDFVPTSGTLTLPAGQTSAAIDISIPADSTNVAETFTLQLSAIGGDATFAAGAIVATGVGTIEPAGTAIPTPTVVVSPASGTVGTDSQILFPVDLSSPSAAAITFAYTTIPGTAVAADFQGSTGTITIPAGQTATEVAVGLLGDSTGTAETFTLTLSSLSADAVFTGGVATTSVLGTINPVVKIAAATATTVTAQSPSLVLGGTDTFTAVVETAAGTPVTTGSVTFVVNQVAVGTVPVDTTGTATYTQAFNTSGTATVAAEYSGDTTNYAASNSAQVIVGVTTLTPVTGKTTVPVSVVAGNAASGTAVVTITNSLAATAKGVVTVHVYASATGVIDGGSVLVATVKKSINLKTGKSIVVAVPVKVVAGALPAGTYTLLSQTIDTSTNVSDALTGPPLTVAPATVTLTAAITRLTTVASVVAGSKTKAAAVVLITNTGNTASTGTGTFSLYASTDGTTADGTLIRTLPKKLTIKPGKSASVSIPLSAYPFVADGSYSIVATYTDGGGHTATAVSAGTTTIAAATVNLTATATTLVGKVTAGKPATVSVTFNNNGNVNATGTVPMLVQLSATADGADPVTVEATAVKTNLAPGKSETAKFKVVIPAGTVAGSYYIVTTVDSSNLLAEPSLADNVIVSAAAVAVAVAVT